jgi:uncharacterized protein (DUF488 family)
MPTIFTIGHSTRSLDELLGLLREHDVRIVADVRTVPKSRRHPQFGREALADALGRAGLRYVHLPELGGLRRPRPDSPNGAWRNASFRGYADHLGSDAFAHGLVELLSLADQGRVAAMCAEAVPWRCHRSLIADALLVRRVAVEHILGPGPTRPHRLTPFAKVDGQHLTYPAEPCRGAHSTPRMT